MRRLLPLLVASLVVLVALPGAHAAPKRITAAGVTLEAPPGWKLARQPDGGATLTHPSGTVVWRFFANEPATDLTLWFDEAWRALGAAHVSVEAGPPEDSPTKTGLSGRVAAGTLTDGGGKRHILIFAAVSDGKRVAPMLIELADADALAQADVLTVASDSIKLVAKGPKAKKAFAQGGWRYPLGGTALVPPPQPAPTQVPAAPETKAPFLGTWSASSTASAGQTHLGSRMLEYELRADGTYTFHAEAWGGTYRANEFAVVDEKGTWSASGDRLTLSPTSVSGVVKDRDGKVTKRFDPPREKVTYRVRTAFFEGLGETQLVLTPPKETARDGAFASNDAYPGSYLLSSTYRPEWRFPR